MKKVAAVLGGVMIILLVSYLFLQPQSIAVKNSQPAVASNTQDPTFWSTPIPTSTPVPTPKPSSKNVLNDVPFTVQSPFAQWSDPRQQDACEEASVLMVMHWVNNQPILGKQAALDEILALSKYQQDNFGSYHDTSAQDTADRLIKGYYHYDDYKVENIDDVQQIIDQLNQGKVVIVPTDGQLLGQPNFTAPGPERHMLVLKSFDPKTDQFITNDPGIRQGQNWRYNKDVLFGAIRDYPTGDHKPIVGVEKRMIVVSKSG